MKTSIKKFLKKKRKIKIPKLKFPKVFKNKTIWLFLGIIFISSSFGFLAGAISGTYFYLEVDDFLNKINIEKPQKIIEKEYIPQTTQEEKIITAVNQASQAVVSIIVSKDLPVLEKYYVSPFEDFFNDSFDAKIPQYKEKGTEKKEIGGGTGFIISKDGLIVTNKHVVLDEEADYAVLTNDGRSFDAEVLARDPVQDLAIIKINGTELPTVELGDSSKLQIGQSVITIGNALGELRNTISVGVISGLGRTITASGIGLVETIEDVIQTDAAINKGNSGGPLLNLKGEVIGINTATVISAQNIGFAIPVNKVKKDIKQIKSLGKIVYPFLGVRYVLITEKIQKENDLLVNYGVWVIKGSGGQKAIFPDSAADKAGLQENDIILEFNNEKITIDNSLVKIIVKYDPGDKAVLKILRDGKEKLVNIILGERE